MPNQADDEANKPWMIRDVPERTRRFVKTYAAMQNITLAQALERLVDQALGIIDFESPSFAETAARIQKSIQEELERQAAVGKQFSGVEITFRYADDEGQTIEAAAPEEPKE